MAGLCRPGRANGQTLGIAAVIPGRHRRRPGRMSGPGKCQPQEITVSRRPSHDGAEPFARGRGRRVGPGLTQRLGRRRTRRLLTGVDGPGPADRPGAREQVTESVTRRGAEQREDHRHTAAGLAPITRPGSVSSGPTPHTSESARPGDQRAAAVIDDRLPGVPRPPAPGGPLTPVPRRNPDTGRAQRQHGRQRLGRGRQRPPS